MRLLNNESIDQGISAKFDRKNRFVITRYKAKNGLYIYLLSNSSNNDRLTIAHFLLDRFRAFLWQLSDKIKSAVENSEAIAQKLYFKDIEFYRFQYADNTLNSLIITDSRNSRRFHVAREAIDTLIKLLYSPKMDHPNGTFDLIVDYHKLFQFTFNEGSESITSGLTIRRDILIDHDDYTPRDNNSDETASNSGRDRIISITTDLASLEQGLKNLALESGQEQTRDKGRYKRKLGERTTDHSYTVDYETLFGGSQHNNKVRQAAVYESIANKSTATSCPVPLLASDIKSHATAVYKCELSQQDASALREGFLADRDAENLLGFEILTAIYKKNGKLKSFRFPLYYMNIKIEESGRYLHIYPPANGDLYLNHLSLAALIETFSESKKSNPLKIFFNTLLSQKIQVDRKLQDLTIHRQLPYSEEIFRQTRELLIGLPGENGKGGIIENLKIVGIECDLESVILYKAARNPSPLARALDNDLKNIQLTAHEYPHRFYSSLLGQFLNPEIRDNPGARTGPFCTTPLQPGTLTRSSKALIDNLNHHNLVLLEGPPGTGKTFTIRNLLLHCLNAEKRLLIVSDQKAAIHALTEKLQEYLLGPDSSPHYANSTMNLWKSAIKVVDEIPQTSDNLGVWVNKLSEMLKMDLSREHDWPQDNPRLMEQVLQLDQISLAINDRIGAIFNYSLSCENDLSKITPKHLHPNSNDEIADLRVFLAFIGAGEHTKIIKTNIYNKRQALVSHFIEDRQRILNGPLAACYPDFHLNNKAPSALNTFVATHTEIVQRLVEKKPRTREALHELFHADLESSTGAFLAQDWERQFDPTAKRSLMEKIKRLVIHPCLEHWSELLALLKHQQELLELVGNTDNSLAILRQLQQIHRVLDPDLEEVEHCLALEICLALDKDYNRQSIQPLLKELEKIQVERDALIKELNLLKLASISKTLIANRKNGTNRATSIGNLLESLKSCQSLDTGSGVPILKELQELLWESFPIWICRKQAVPFLFPSRENIIDLVIVDEAGQCRVDDALPLLYRAQKLMVVGDDKQTVIDKNSVIDDYLFQEFELEEHLRNIQARGVKGGGSNLFELVKSIKQGGVMLDEHYRCPPPIIAYSNQYVYHSDLKIMQWQLPNSAPSVVVDFSEKFASSNKKASSGKYKGIETEMLDRFFNYIAKTIARIENETQTQVNVETDVAICYFLLKNEPYIKDQKSKFLHKLQRGSDVLDGAGAALQGKERKYIFYLWDINSSNISYFRQGDDPDKRKGELNVLMSRPKVRAYHYLHSRFDSLKHDSATVTDYLWRTYQSQNEKRIKIRPEFENTIFKNTPPDAQRSSGESMYSILSYLWEFREVDIQNRYEPYFNIVIGNPKQKIDLMLVAKNNSQAIAVVDLGSFQTRNNPADDLIDYYFQLQRAIPAIEPVFAFMHELADERSHAYQLIEQIAENR